MHECMICLREGADINLLPTTTGFFHNDCVVEWLEKKEEHPITHEKMSFSDFNAHRVWLHGEDADPLYILLMDGHSDRTLRHVVDEFSERRNKSALLYNANRQCDEYKFRVAVYTYLLATQKKLEARGLNEFNFGLKLMKGLFYLFCVAAVLFVLFKHLSQGGKLFKGYSGLELFIFAAVIPLMIIFNELTRDLQEEYLDKMAKLEEGLEASKDRGVRLVENLHYYRRLVIDTAESINNTTDNTTDNTKIKPYQDYKKFLAT